jgi:hypothetical protein
MVEIRIINFPQMREGQAPIPDLIAKSRSGRLVAFPVRAADRENRVNPQTKRRRGTTHFQLP